MSLLNDIQEKLPLLLPPMVIAVLASGVRFVLSPTDKTFGDYVRGVFVAGVVAYLANLAMIDAGITEGMRAVFTGILAFIADDLLVGALKAGSEFRKDPLGWFVRVKSAVRGNDPKDQ